MESKEIQQRVEEHYNFLLKHYKSNQILGVFLFGSQNYNLATENSDVDTKAIYIPTLEELVFNEKPLSKVFDLPNGEKCEIKDIREMVKNFKKQNINFIEILFTKYYYLNKKYEFLWNEFFINNREAIARYDVHIAVRSMSHQALHTLKEIKDGNFTRREAKKIANAARLCYFLNNYIKGEPYEKCIIPKKEILDYLMEIKQSKENNYSFIKDATLNTLNEMVKKNYQHLVDPVKKESINNKMQQGAIEMIKLNF